MQNYKNTEKEYSERRKNDLKKTQKIERFTEKIYRENHVSFSRVYQRDLQLKGVDLTMMINGRKRYVDEKFALNYYNRPLFTYSFELSSRNNHEDNGWFTSKNNITEFYSLLWFLSDENLDNITEYEICIIEKRKIKEYLKTVGYYDGILEDFNKYWSNPTENPSYYEQNNRRYLKLKNGIKIVQSLQFEKEQPINVVIPRSVLCSLATYHFTNVKKD